MVERHAPAAVAIDARAQMNECFPPLRPLHLNDQWAARGDRYCANSKFIFITYFILIGGVCILIGLVSFFYDLFRISFHFKIVSYHYVYTFIII